MISTDGRADGAPPLPAGPFGAILADPPWRFRSWDMLSRAKPGERWGRQLAGAPYDVMDTDAIAALPVGGIAGPDCVLFLWATYPTLPDALGVMAAWGFMYKTCAHTWVKRNPSGVGWHLGLGYWTRGNPELCLLGTRGRPRRRARDVRNLIIAPRRQHSRKPDQIYACIERLVPGPYCELFARRPWPGWTSWGNELKPEGVDIAKTRTAQPGLGL